MLQNFSKIRRVILAAKNVKWSSQSSYTTDQNKSVSTGQAVEVSKNSDTQISSPPSTNNSLDAANKAPITFAQMFKESQFVNLGDLENKYLIGKVVNVVGDDIYIDYGGKFYCICKIPTPDIE